MSRPSGILIIICLVASTLASRAFAKPDASTYTRPLLFAPEDNNIFLTSPQLKWDLENDRLNFGGIAYDGSTIKFLATSKNGRFSLGFSWPTNMSNDGKIEIRVDGKAVWVSEVDQSDISGWKNKLKTDPSLKPLFGTNFGVTRLSLSNIEAFKSNPTAQACFTKKKSDTEWVVICSAPVTVVADASGDIQFQPQTSNTKPTVEILEENLGPRGVANFPGTKPVSLKAIFSTGATLSFEVSVPLLKMLDVVWKGDQATGKEFIVFTGQGAKPLGEVKNLIVPPNHFWSATGTDEEIIWQTTIPKEAPLLRVIAPFKIPFTYIVQFTDLPDEDDRIYISDRTGAGTYAGTPKIYGTIPSQAKIGSHERSVRKSSPNEFEWTFLAPNKGDRNKARISLFKNDDGKEKEWVANYQLYRGYPFQAALRLTGLTNEKFQTAIIGEASLTYFPDTIFANSTLLDYHRWGFSARYFRALTGISITQHDDATDTDSEVELLPFSTVNVDARYNLKPGLWNRDELFGPIISYAKIEFVAYQASFLGVGVFWARTMPLVLDKLFNINPLFRYPKYVDVEFIYYPKPMDSFTQSSANYFLNFQGRIFWTKRFFGEGGFGVKQFKFTPKDETLNPLDFAVGYGTAGLGLTF